MSKLTWTNEQRRLSDLVPWDKNPRQINKEQARRLRQSLAEFGQVQAICIDPGNMIIDGHQRKAVWGMADEYGMDYVVDVRVASRKLTDKEQQKLTIFLGKGAAGEWDFDALANFFQLDDLLDWGFDERELDLDLWPVDEPPEDPGADLDSLDGVRDAWGTEIGQVWQLGNHRIVCGDCTEMQVVSIVMDGKQADMVFTDPPYGVGIGNKNQFLNAFQKAGSRLENIAGDLMGKDELFDMLVSAFTNVREAMADCSSIYVTAPQGGELGLMMMMMMMMMSGLPVRHVLNWVKNQPTFSLGRLDYEYQHEPILYTWKKTHKHYGRGEHNTSTWFVDRPRESKLHPTMKPVELVENSILNSTENDMIVLDPFLGSGTTLIACERLGRKCRAVEISPAYVAVTLERWSVMTGQQPLLLDS